MGSRPKPDVDAVNGSYDALNCRRGIVVRFLHAEFGTAGPGPRHPLCWVMPDRPSRPTPLGDVLANVLAQAGISDRVAQAAVVPEWESLVGAQIAAVTEPLSVTPDGTLFVAVASHGWMTELSLLEPELLRQLNGVAGRPPIARIRMVLKR
jgi:predicted nucleic acid-binding Zn ribbon protein